MGRGGGGSAMQASRALTSHHKILLNKSANCPKRTSKLRSALSIQEFSVNNLPFAAARKKQQQRSKSELPPPAQTTRVSSNPANWQPTSRQHEKAPPLNSRRGADFSSRPNFAAPFARLDEFGEFPDFPDLSKLPDSASFPNLANWAGFQVWQRGPALSLHPITKFCLSNKQTARSARKHCEARYQFRNFLWITCLFAGAEGFARRQGSCGGGSGRWRAFPVCPGGLRFHSTRPRADACPPRGHEKSPGVGNLTDRKSVV